VRRDNLIHLHREGRTVVQIDTTLDTPLIAFAGEKTTHREFAKRLKIEIAPVVFFFNAQGTQLAKPLVGAGLADFYHAYLETAFDEAKTKIKTP
jgi:hypothetical protein